MREIARTFYWLLPLKMVSRDVIIEWADELIGHGVESDAVIELSTCGSHDENDVMDNLKKIGTGYNVLEVRNNLLQSLRDYLANNGDRVSIKLLFYYMCIDDLNEDDRTMFSIAEDAIVCARDGVCETIPDSERQYMIDLINHQLSPQQGRSSELQTRRSDL